MLELNPPKGLGFIVRTAGQDRTKKELSRDLAYLLRLWKVIVRRVKKTTGPIDIYEESDMMIRTIRDIVTSATSMPSMSISKSAFERAQRVPGIGDAAAFVGKLHHYDGKEPLYHKYQSR